MHHSSIEIGLQEKFIIRFDLLRTGDKSHVTNVFLIIQTLVLSLNYQDLAKKLFWKPVVHKEKAVVTKEIAEKRKEYVVPRTINNYRHREGLKTETHVSDRLWLCDWLTDWNEEDFLHPASSDEFHVRVIRRPNYQKNDRIWAKSVDNIEEDERYFRDIILIKNVMPFLKNESIFVHDKAPCMRANQTQHLLQDNGVKFWGNDIWPVNSPNLNVAEHIGTILKDEVEKQVIRR